MRRYAILFSMLFLGACASADLHKQDPCRNLQGQSRAECLTYTREECRDTAREGSPAGYERVLQGIDRCLHGTIDYLFY
ncbi:MAG: hypothetical protein C4530_05340 [Desulfobacteraceae bacterium]|nr:MAG: hypothetical protein C4530_05340 [Desulfobacteraceae bacterium]